MNVAGARDAAPLVPAYGVPDDGLPLLLTVEIHRILQPIDDCLWQEAPIPVR
jgi:hypothetical protein